MLPPQYMKRITVEYDCPETNETSGPMLSLICAILAIDSKTRRTWADPSAMRPILREI